MAQLNLATGSSHSRLKLVIVSLLVTWIFAAGLTVPIQAQVAQAQIPTSSLADGSSQTTELLRRRLLDANLDQRRAAALSTRSASTNIQVDLLPEFIEILRHENDGQVRLAIFDTLTDLGPRAAVAVPALAYAMQHDFGGRRNEEKHQDYRAALALASVGPMAVECLRNLIADSQDNVRAEAAMALGRIGEEASVAIPDLIHLLSDSDERVRSDATFALSKMGASALEPLLTASRDQEEIIRAAAIRALGNVGTNEHASDMASSAILEALQDDSPSVRRAAVDSLVILIESPQALREHLKPLLQDPSPEVIDAACNQFAQSPEMLEGTEQHLLTLLTNERDLVASRAAFLLSICDPNQTVQLLVAAQDARTRMNDIAESLASQGETITPSLEAALEHQSPRVRACGALALGTLRPVAPTTATRLGHLLLNTSPELQEPIVRAIAKLGNHALPAAPQLREILVHRDAKLRVLAIETLLLAAQHDQQLIDQLTTALTDRDPTVQLAVLSALKSLGPQAATSIPAVISQLDNTNPAVQTAAAELLANQGPAAAAAVPEIKRILEHSSPEKTVVLVTTLGQLGDTAVAALPQLLPLLESDMADLRAAVLGTLSNFDLDLPQVRAYILPSMGDKDEIVRNRAYSAIRKMGPSATQLAPDLILLLEDEVGIENVERLLERLLEYSVSPQTVANLIALLPPIAGSKNGGSLKEKSLKFVVRFLAQGGQAALEAVPQLQQLELRESSEIRDAAKLTIEKLSRSSR
ncbi:MAG: HEAT repeat domain-containing protein [Planctomycetales bacterium]|nr:HEAT repeat domain-containing protein [Planctomycetales bacterium]